MHIASHTCWRLFSPEGSPHGGKRVLSILLLGIMLGYQAPAFAEGPRGDANNVRVENNQNPPGGQLSAGSPSIPSRLITRVIMMGQFAAILALLCWIGVRRFRSPIRNEEDRNAVESSERMRVLLHALPWVAIGVMALILRVVLVSGSVFHENHHGYGYIMAMVLGMTETYGGFASSYIVLMHEITVLFGTGDQVIFFTNAFFSATSCVFLGMLAKRLTDSTVAGWTAALMWALTPYAIRLAPTEMYGNYVMFMFLAAVLATIAAMDAIRKNGLKASWAWMVVAIFLVVLEARGRVLTLIHPAAILLIVLGAGAGRTREEATGLVLGAIASALLLVTQAFDVFYTSRTAKAASLVNPGCNISQFENFSFLDTSILPETLLPLSLAGGAMLILGLVAPRMTQKEEDDPGVSEKIRRYLVGRWRPICVILGILLVGLLAGSVCGTFSSRLRLELLLNALLTLLAALAGGGCYLLTRKFLKVGALVFPAIVVASAWAPTSVLKLPLHEFVEYGFLQDTVLPEVRKQGDQVRLVVPNAPQPAGKINLSWWQKELPGVQVSRNATDLEEGGPLYAYVGLECFWAAPGSQKDFGERAPFPEAPTVNGLQIHPECAKALTPYQWEEVLITEVPHAYSGLAYCNPCVDIKPDAESAQFGLFKAR